MLNEFCTFLTFHFVLILSLFFVPFPFYFSNQSKYGAFAGSIFFQVWWPGMGGWSRGSDWVGPLFSTWSTKIVFGPKVDTRISGPPDGGGTQHEPSKNPTETNKKKYKRKSAQSKTQLECEIILHSTCVLFFCIYLCTYFFSLFPSHFSQKVYALSAGKDFRKEFHLLQPYIFFRSATYPVIQCDAYFWTIFCTFSHQKNTEATQKIKKWWKPVNFQEFDCILMSCFLVKFLGLCWLCNFWSKI